MPGLSRRPVFIPSALAGGGAPSIAISPPSSITEGNASNTTIVYTVTRTGNTVYTTEAEWSVLGYGASPVATNDFVGGYFPRGKLVFAPGETVKYCSFEIRGDYQIEPDESYTLALSNIRHSIAQTSQSVIGVIPNTDTDAISTVNLSTLAFPLGSWRGKTVATIITDNPGSTHAISGANASMFTVQGDDLILESEFTAIGQTLAITVTSSIGANSVTQAFTPVVVADPPITSLFARFSTQDESKVTVVSGKVSEWTDSVAGYKIGQATAAQRPNWDTSVLTPGGQKSIKFTAASTTRLFATLGGSSGRDDPLISLLNAANKNFTVILVTATPNVAGASGGDTVVWGTTDAGQPGGARNYVLIKQGNNGRQFNISRGDQTNAGSTVVSTPSAAASATGFHLHAVLGGGDVNGSGGNSYNAHTDLSLGGTPVSAGIYDGASVSNSFSVGARVTGAGTTNAFDSYLVEINIYDGLLTAEQYKTEARNIASRLGVDIGYVPPTRIDLSGYTKTFEDTFNRDTVYETDQNKYYGIMSQPWIPGYTTARFPYGTPGALTSEDAWMVDPNHPRMAPYNPFFTYKQTLYITSSRRPAELSDLTMPEPGSGGKVETTWLAGALISLGNGAGFWQQYGYFEFLAKMPFPGPGVFPALWLLAITNRWPPEIDIMEMFGIVNNASAMTSTLHNDPWWPRYKNIDTVVRVPGTYTTPNNSEDYHLFGVDWQADYIKFYYDGVLVGTVPSAQGLLDITITNGGSGVLADNGKTDGTIAIIADSPTLVTAEGTANVVGGVIVSATIKQPGSGFNAGNATWTRTGNRPLGGSAVLTSTPSVDPAIPLMYHVPMYILMNLAKGAFTGTPENPATLAIRRVRVYRKNIVAPAVISGVQSESQSFFDRCAAAGSALSSPKQTAINDAICELKRWNNLRKDTMPMGGDTSDWDVTKLSLAQSLMGLYQFKGLDPVQAKINLLNPVTGADLVPYGSPVFDSGGVTFSGTIGQYLDSQIALSGSNLFRQDDHGMGILLGTTPSNTTLASVMGSSGALWLNVSNVEHRYRSMASIAPTAILKYLGVEAGDHLAYARGWRFAQLAFKNGRAFHASYGATSAFSLGSMLIGANSPTVAGFAGTLKSAYWGRRHMPDEQERLDIILKALDAAL